MTTTTGARRAKPARERPAPQPKRKSRKSLSGSRKPGKYGNRSTKSALIGLTFHSAAECRFAEHLYARELNGEISDLSFQPRVTLLGAVPMRPDFTYIEDGRRIWHEFKGFATDKWRMQKKLWAQVGPGEYRITYARKGDKIYPYRTDSIFPKPSDELIELVRAYLAETTDGQTET